MEYIEIIFLLSYYEDIKGTYISDYLEEIKKRKLFFRNYLKRKLSRSIKTAIGEITYCLYLEQLNAEKQLLLSFHEMKIKN